MGRVAREREVVLSTEPHTESLGGSQGAHAARPVRREGSTRSHRSSGPTCGPRRISGSRCGMTSARVAEAVLDLEGDPRGRGGACRATSLARSWSSSCQSGAGDPPRSSVIDGQQRLTTLQLVLDAAQLVMEQAECDDVAESIHELVVNDSKRFRRTPKRFKLWPSRVDRDAFECRHGQREDCPACRSMTAGSSGLIASSSTRCTSGQPSDDEVGPANARGRDSPRSPTVLQQHLQIVAIDLCRRRTTTSSSSRR